MVTKYKVAVIGCGAIFSRHLQAIRNNSEYFELVGIFDIDSEKLSKVTQELGVKAYASEEEVYRDTAINCVIIITPSYLHYEQMVKAVSHKKNVIVEKPATFLAEELKHINQLALVNGVDVFTILQVRLNPSLIATREFILSGVFGKIRNIALVQRWQRPLEYFTGWRGKMSSGGGILREFSIHYFDAMIHLLGMPRKVNFASSYKTKFINSDVVDTIYVNLDFGNFGGSIEVSIGAEPKNLACSLSIMSEFGYICLGGKSLDQIIEVQFLDLTLNQQLQSCLDRATKNSVANLASMGASPYHPELYRQIVVNPEMFQLQQTYNVIKLIEDIYSFV